MNFPQIKPEPQFLPLYNPDSKYTPYGAFGVKQKARRKKAARLSVAQKARNFKNTQKFFRSQISNEPKLDTNPHSDTPIPEFPKSVPIPCKKTFFKIIPKGEPSPKTTVSPQGKVYTKVSQNADFADNPNPSSPIPRNEKSPGTPLKPDREGSSTSALSSPVPFPQVAAPFGMKGTPALLTKNGLVNAPLIQILGSKLHLYPLLLKLYLQGGG